MRKSELNTIQRRDSRIRRMRLLSRFTEVESTLHKECFYDGDCRVPLVTDIIDDAREYLDDVESLVNRR